MNTSTRFDVGRNFANKFWNGTFVEGKKVDAVRIEDGLEVVIGPAVLKFYDEEI